MKFLLGMLFFLTCLLLGCAKKEIAEPQQYVLKNKRTVYEGTDYLDEVNKSLEGSGVKFIEVNFPKYPREAERRGIVGVVVLKYIVDEQGLVKNVVILRSPDETLSEACRQAVLTWRFVPFLENGKPVKKEFTESFPFQLQ